MPDLANLAQLCREAAEYAGDAGQVAWVAALLNAATTAEAMAEWEAEQLAIDLAAGDLFDSDLLDYDEPPPTGELVDAA